VYGCDIDCVREIIPWRRATRLPGAPAHVQGLVNLRGSIITVLDLAARLEPDAPPPDESHAGRSIILLAHGARVVGAAVDEVMDVQGVVR
jgi:purine-binding chemotaxis protein CheW